MPTQPTLASFGDILKQYPGQQQVDRAVEVSVPGRFFHWLPAADQKNNFTGSAIEFRDRHDFERHRAWGVAHTGAGIHFVCESDALDDPDHKGFWTTLGLWNRWRHETYKDDRQAELMMNLCLA